MYYKSFGMYYMLFLCFSLGILVVVQFDIAIMVYMSCQGVFEARIRDLPSRLGNLAKPPSLPPGRFSTLTVSTLSRPLRALIG